MVDEKHRVSFITIRDNEVSIYPHNAKNAFVFNLDTFIGDRIAERELYDRTHPGAFIYINGVLDTICDDDFQPNFNTYDSYWAVSAAKDFIEKTDNLNSRNTLTALEEMRIKNEISFLCSIENETYFYRDCETMREILFSVLHYMTINGLSFKRCKLCGKLFIPQKSQENYCTRPFEYYNWEGKLKHYQTCKYARKSIIQSLKARKTTILDMLKKRVDRNGVPFCDLPNEEDYNDALATFSENKDLHHFKKLCEAFELKIKTNHTIENFVEYETFLYVSCDKFYKRYGKRGV